MQLVPLSTDGRVTALGSPTRPAPGPLRVVLEPDNTGVRIVALGHGTPRPVGRLGARDVAAYGPVLLRLAERGFLGTCPAQFMIDGTLVLDLAPAPECVLEPVPAEPRRPVRPAPSGTSVLPRPSTARPPALAVPSRRRSRHLVGVTGAVVGVLVLASALGNSGGDDGGAATASALPAAVATPVPPPSTRTIPTTAETTATTATIEAVDEPVLVAAAPATRSKAATPRSATARPSAARPRPVTTPPTTTRPTPTRTTTKPAPRTATSTKPPTAAAQSGCDPNYSGCVPIASDVDCEGGSGNGPAYVRGPVQVKGTDVYGLDNDDDGIGCEKN